MKRKNVLFLIIILLASSFLPHPASAEVSIPQQDQTSTTPLGSPGLAVRPRYISGFGVDNSYTIFYEDRTPPSCSPIGFRIYFNQTTTGPFGLAATSTFTNICDTHFIVKNWPNTIGVTTYAYRGWGGQGNNTNHAFYATNDLANWTQIYLGSGMFSDPGGVLAGDTILYGFHDIVQLNGNYMGFAESAGGHTYIVWSDNGDQTWSVIARVGGSALTDHLVLPASPTPTGNFILMELGGLLTYGKLYNNGSNSASYLIINRAAAQAATPAQAEAAFLNPINWTWSDGSTGQPLTVSPVLASTLTPTSGHNIKEGWTVPTSNPRSNHVILYTADYMVGGPPRLGCAADNAQCLVVIPQFPTVIVSIPADGSVLSTGPTQLTVTFSENVKNDGSAGAANNISNYLLFEDGINGVFDTVDCAGGVKPNDTNIFINNAVYAATTFTASLNINNGAPLPAGTYRLLACGTTSIENLAGNKLNNGLTDTAINFSINTSAGNTSSGRPNKQSLPATGFPMGTVTLLPKQPANKTYTSYGNLWLEIPSIGVKASIVGVPASDNIWDVTWLGNEVGWLNGTAFPTWAGNSVITGHVWDAYNNPGIFVNLKQLKYGDLIKIHLLGQVYINEVRQSILASPAKTDTVFRHEELPWLTLVTCENYKGFWSTYSYRRAIRAVQISIETEK